MTSYYQLHLIAQHFRYSVIGCKQSYIAAIINSVTVRIAIDRGENVWEEEDVQEWQW